MQIPVNVQFVLKSDVVYPQPKPWWGIDLNATFANAAANLTLKTPGERTVGFGFGRSGVA